MLLRPAHSDRDIGASSARERIAYLVGTTICLAAAASLVIKGEALARVHGGRASSGGFRSWPRARPCGVVVVALLGALPLVVILWAIGGNVYWVSLVLKMRNCLVSDSPHG